MAAQGPMHDAADASAAHDSETKAHLAEAARREAARPWASNVRVDRCPHCGEETADGHYICWNCSNDVREPTEEQVHSELQTMLAKQALQIERRNQKALITVVTLVVLWSLLTIRFWPHYWGFHVLGVVAIAIALGLYLSSKRRQSRVENTHGL